MKTDRYLLVLAVLLAIGLMAAGFVTCHGAEPSCKAWEPPVGTVIATRNLNEADNGNPGWLNHLAIYSGGGIVIEAQSGPPYGYGVLSTPLATFLARPYSQPLYFLPRDPAVGVRAAAIAQTCVGQPFGQFASIGPMRIRSIVPNVLGWPQRQNCVSVVRRAYEQATGLALWSWRIPDDTWQMGWVLQGPYVTREYAETPQIPPPIPQ